MLQHVTITVNYPEDSGIETATPSEMTTIQLEQYIRRLIETEHDATSFVITAAIKR